MAPLKGVVLTTGLVSKLKLVFQLLAAGTTLAGVGWAAAAGVLRMATLINLALALLTGYGSMVGILWSNRDLWRRPSLKMEIR